MPYSFDAWYVTASRGLLQRLSNYASRIKTNKSGQPGGLTIKEYFKVLSKTTMTTRAVTNPKQVGSGSESK